jgi:leader peptidase (prepilin peptidase)/N-methyltransferase
MDAPIGSGMELALPFAGMGFALGWPIEWLIQRFPQGVGTPPSVRRRWLVAALTAALFAALTLKIGFHPRLAPALLLTALIVPASVIDLNHRIIPNLINYPGALLVFTVASFAEPGRLGEFALGGFGCMLFLGLAWAVSRGGMGLGDVKMALMIGLGTGRYAFVALLAGFVASSALSGFLVVRGGRQALKSTFPFGPFLAVGTVVALLWGPSISPYLLGGH